MSCNRCVATIFGLAAAMAAVAVPRGAAADEAPPRLIAVYAVQPALQAPTIDGDLADPCWSNAPATTTYYEYWKPQPGPGALQGSLRLRYDREGLYLAIVNHEARLDRLRAAIRGRGNPDLWSDDCAEIYLAPSAEPPGFTYFAINSRGARNEYRRIDTAVVLNEWRGEGTRMATGRTADAWTIEAFIPWSDMAATPAPGDVWRFDHVRYAYTSGQFQGVTWSPGGNYNSPQNFGYLVFVGNPAPTPAQLGAILGARVTAPWQMLDATGVLTCRGAGQVSHERAAAVLAAARARVVAALDEGARFSAPALTEVREALTKVRAAQDALPSDVPSETLQALHRARELDALARQARALLWRARLIQLVEQTASLNTEH